MFVLFEINIDNSIKVFNLNVIKDINNVIGFYIMDVFTFFIHWQFGNFFLIQWLLPLSTVIIYILICIFHNKLLTNCYITTSYSNNAKFNWIFIKFMNYHIAEIEIISKDKNNAAFFNYWIIFLVRIINVFCLKTLKYSSKIIQCYIHTDMNTYV